MWKSSSIALVVLAASAGPSDATPKRQADYYPLGVGARWDYACTIEAAPADPRSVTIAGKIVHRGTTYYTEVTRDGADERTAYLFVDRGLVRRKYRLESDTSFVVGAKTLRAGLKLDELVVRREASPAPFGKWRAPFRAESGPSAQSDPTWTATWFAPDVGVVAQGNGAEGECKLSRYIRGK